MTSIIFDLESNSKRPEQVTKLWCLSWQFLNDEEPRTITAHGVEAAEPLMRARICKLFKSVDTLIGHNIIAYDLPVLSKLVFKCDVRKIYSHYKIIDTLVMSRALDPDRDCKSHDLASWGKRLGGEQKVEQATWDKWDPNYIPRCEGDVKLTKRTLDALVQEVVTNHARST